MKIISHSIKLALIGGFAAAGIGCLGGTTAGNSPGSPNQTGYSTEGPNEPEVQASASPQSGGHMHDMAMGTNGMTALKELNGQDFDIAFMSQMITHHQGAIDMARQTIKVAQRSETKQEAQSVIETQTKEIAQMKGWLKDWYNAEPSKEQQELMHQDMGVMMDMQIQYDYMFFDLMIPHHKGAIEMSELATEKSPRQELKDLANKMKKDQTAEIRRYQDMDKP